MKKYVAAIVLAIMAVVAVGQTSTAIGARPIGHPRVVKCHKFQVCSTPTPTATPSATTTPTPTPTPSTPQWNLIFEDNFLSDIPEGSFPGNTLTGSWGAYPYPWPDTSGVGTYDQRIISVHDGVMDLHLRYENGEYKAAAPVPNIPGEAGTRYQTYGRYEARWLAEPVPGYATAWLLWPKSETWPRDGEIDFPEGRLDGTIKAFMHHQGATSGGDQDAFDSGVTFAGAWHTTVVEWTPNSVSFYLDGSLVGRSTERIPNTPMRWVLQTETAYGSIPPTDVNGHVLIDYVRVWDYVS